MKTLLLTLILLFISISNEAKGTNALYPSWVDGTIENRSGMIVGGITPYEDMDFLSNMPYFYLVHGSDFYYASWTAFQLSQKNTFLRYLINFIPPSPGYTYLAYDSSNSSCSIANENHVKNELFDNFCSESNTIWNKTVNSYTSNKIKFDQYGFIDLTENGNPTPVGFNIVKDKSNTFVGNHIILVKDRLTQVRKSISNWDMWYSWCAFPKKVGLNVIGITINYDADQSKRAGVAATLQPLGSDAGETGSLSPVSVMLNNQFNCVSENLNYITSYIYLNSLIEDTGSNHQYYPYNVNSNLPAIINLQPLHPKSRSNGGKNSAQRLPSRGWFDAVGIFNYYKERCRIEINALQDILSCLVLTKPQGDPPNPKTQKAWSEVDVNSNSVKQCQNESRFNKKPFGLLGYGTDSKYNYKIIQNFENTSISSLHVELCVDPAYKIGETEYYIDGIDSEAILGGEIIHSCNGEACKDSESELFKALFRWQGGN